MSGLVTGRRSPIGIDVGSRAVKAVQLERGCRGGGWRVAAAAAVPRLPADRYQAGAPATSAAAPADAAPADQALAAVTAPSAGELNRLYDTLERQGFSGRQVVLAVPDARLLTSVLEVPARTGQAPV